MDLELQEVAGLLQVSEEQLLKWVSEGKIPAYFINDHYRFNRQEIEAWVMRQKQNPENGAQDDAQKQSGSMRFNLFRALNNGDVFFDIDGKTKPIIIHETMKRLAPLLRLDVEVLTELFMDRENLVSTAVGNGFAIPHARDFLLRGHRDMVSVVFLRKPIAYGALDSDPVHTLFFLMASDDKKHLALISKLAHLAADSQMKKILEKKPSKMALLEHVKTWESAL